MKVIEPHVEVWSATPGAIDLIEDAGRTCYKSKSIGDPDAFVEGIIRRGHESVIEHATATVLWVTNRGVTHELVRHRVGIAYSQESTRYCNYGSDHVTFIRPHKCTREVLGEWPIDGLMLDENHFRTPETIWLVAMYKAEKYYKSLLAAGWKPEDARGVLPNDLKTEIVITANMRTWRHIFKLRGSKAAHPQIRQMVGLTLPAFQELWPVLFDDLEVE